MRKGLYTVDTVNHYEKSKPLTWSQATADTFGYKYAPLADTVTESMLFGNMSRDPSFNFLEAIEGYEEKAKHLVKAKNQEHFDFLRLSLERNEQRRQRLEQEGFSLKTVAAEFIDPLNLGFGLPVMGKLGLLTRSGMTASQAAYVSAKAGLAAGVAAETLRAPFDPLATTSEVALNVGSSAVFGGLIGGSLAGVANLAKNGFTRVKAAENDFNTAVYGDKALDDVVGDVPVNYKAANKTSSPSVYFDGSEVRVDQARVKEEFYDFPWTKTEVKYEKALGREQIDSKQMYHDFLVHRAVLRKGGWSEDLISPKAKEKINKYEEIIFDISNKYGTKSPKQLELIEVLPERIQKIKDEELGQWYTDTSSQALDNVTTGQSYRSTPNVVFSDGFANSLLFKSVSTPVTRSMLSKATDATKRDILGVAGSGSLPIERNTAGYSQTSYVNRSRNHVNYSNQLIKELEDIHAQYELGQSEARRFFGESFKGKDFDNFLETVVTTRTKLETNPSLYEQLPDAYKEAISRIDSFYDRYLDMAQDVGIMPDVKNIRLEITRLKQKIDDIETEMEATTREDVLTNLAADRLEYVKELNFFEGLPAIQRNKRYFPRNYMTDLIAADDEMRAAFEAVWAKHFRRFPVREIWDDEQGAWIPNPHTPEEFAAQVVANIIQEEPFVPYRTKTQGRKLSKYARQRVSFDIPDEEMLPFIYKDATVFHAYSNRMGRSIEFKRGFGDRTIDDITRDIVLRERKNGLTDDEIAPIVRDIVIEFDRANGSFYRDPSRWDNRLASAGKGLAQVAYLGKAAYAAIGDTHAIVGARGFTKTFTPFLNDIERQVMSMNRNDLRKLTEALGPGQVSSFNRMMADNTEIRTAMREEKLMNKALKMYHTLPIGSFLHPMTRMFRGLHGGLIVSEFIERSIKIANGTAKRIEIEELARSGIDVDTAKIIAGYKDYWTKPGELYQANITDWPVDTPAQREALFKMVNALETNIANTILFAQQADKPAIMDGIVYFPYKPWMKKMGFEPDERMTVGNKQYTSVGSGLLGWPFVFMSYSLAAVPRVVGKLADPMREHRMTQAMMAIAAGSLVVMLRNATNPDYFEYTKKSDLIRKSIEYSGIGAIYGEALNMSLHMAFGSGLVEQDEFIFRGDYKVEGSDAATELFGAPFSVFQGFAEGARAFINGDTNEGIAEISRSMPKINVLLWQKDIEDLFDAINGTEN